MSLRPTAEEAATAYAEMVVAHDRQMQGLFDDHRAASDRWEGRARNFRPGNMEAPEIDKLLMLLRPSDTVLDIGAGAGRYAIPLGGYVARVIGVEPSPAMRDELTKAISEAGRTNIEIVALEWPAPPGERAPTGDVSLVANVLYGMRNLLSFLAAFEAHTLRTCIVITFDTAPSNPVLEVWEELYGEPYRPLPGLRELVAVLLAMGRRVDIQTIPAAQPLPQPLEEALGANRWLYRIEPGSEREAILRGILQRSFGAPSGLVQMPRLRQYSAVISWPPGS